MDFIGKEGNGEYSIPVLGTASQRIGSLAFKFLNSSAGRMLVAGMNVGNTVKGSKAGLKEAVASLDYALALSADYVLKKIRDRLKALYPLPYKLARSCTVSSPFSSDCWNWSIVRLTELNTNLIWGYIKISGKIYIRNTGALIPDETASFVAFLKLSVSPSQTLQVTVESIFVSLGEWYSNLFNFLSGNAFVNGISEGIRSALGSATGSGFTDFLTPQALGRLASVGTTNDLEITPVATNVHIRNDAIIIHGNINVSNTDNNPLATFTSSKIEGNMLHYKFHAGQSWAPGGTVVEYEWEFGDGQVKITSGTNARFVTEHPYAMLPVQAGAQTMVCLTVTDNKGRKAKTCGPVGPIPLITGICPPTSVGIVSPWEVAWTNNIFLIHLCGFMPDVFVRVTGVGVAVEGYTDRNGKVSFTLEAKHFGRLESDTSGQGKAFETGRVLVEATKDGFKPVRRYLSMVRTDERKAFIDKNSHRLNEMTKELRALLRRDGFQQDSKPIELMKRPVDHCLKAFVEDLGLSIDVLGKVIRLVENGSDMIPIMTLLGIHTDKTDPSEVLTKRFDESISTISKAVSLFRKKSYLPKHDMEEDNDRNKKQK